MNMSNNNTKAPEGATMQRKDAKATAKATKGGKGWVPAWMSADGSLDSYYGSSAYASPYMSRTGD